MSRTPKTLPTTPAHTPLPSSLTLAKATGAVLPPLVWCARIGTSRTRYAHRACTCDTYSDLR